MPVMPGVKWEPLTGHTNGPMHAWLGVALHCNDAQSLDLHDFFQRNDVSSHWQVTKTGLVYQYLDTAVSSWCQSDGNNTYLSIESQGLASELATPEQIAAIGAILAWAHQTPGIPLQLANTPGERGLGWHGMGAPSWGHALCPGVRKNQRSQMLDAATKILNPITPPGVPRMILAHDPVTKTIYLQDDSGLHPFITLADVVAYLKAGVVQVDVSHAMLQTLPGH